MATPDAEGLFWRAKAWGVIVSRSLLEPKLNRWTVEEAHQDLADKLNLCEQETRLLTAPQGELTQREFKQAKLHGEALAVALWALGLDEFPPQDAPVELLATVKKVGEASFEQAQLQGADDLEEGLQSLFWTHRRVYAFLRGHKKMRLTTWLANSGMDIPKFVRLKRGDLLFDGLPIGRSDASSLPWGADYELITGTRLKAARWMMGFCDYATATGSPYEAELDEAPGAATLYNVESSSRKMDSRGAMASHSAAWYGQVKRLADSTSSSNFDLEGLTALHCALLNGQEDAVRALVEEHRVSADIPDGRGRTPLTTAIQARSGEAVSLLLQLGAKVDGPIGSRPPLFTAIATGDQETVSILLENGADLEAFDSEKRTPLVYAALRGEFACVQELLGAGARIKARDELGNTALHYAAEKGQVYIVRALLQARAKLERTNDLQQTPLARACYFGKVDAAMALLDAGGTAQTEAANGQTPLHYACRQGLFQLVRRLLDAGADPTAEARDGYTPLHAAALSGKENLVRLLLRSGADATAQDRQGVTPLHAAVNRGFEQIADSLLGAGAEVGSTTEKGETPLHVTAYGMQPMKCLGFLLKNGADPLAQDQEGCTPLHLLTRAGQIEAAQLLVAAGGLNQLPDELGKTPLDWARERGLAELESMLNT